MPGVGAGGHAGREGQRTGGGAAGAPEVVSRALQSRCAARVSGEAQGSRRVGTWSGGAW